MRGVASNDAPGLQLAIALGAAVYTLSDKKSVPRGAPSQPAQLGIPKMAGAVRAHMQATAGLETCKC